MIVPRLRAIEESFDESCVMFFEPGDPADLARCILELHDHPEKRKQLAENAYRRYATISWAQSKKTYLQVVDELVRPRFDGNDVQEGVEEMEEPFDAEDNLQYDQRQENLALELGEPVEMRDR